jgi:hypothetical protein
MCFGELANPCSATAPSTKNKIIIIRNVIFNENEFFTSDFELFKNKLITINTKALA